MGERSVRFEIEPTGRVRLAGDDIVCFLRIPRTGGGAFGRVLSRHAERGRCQLLAGPHDVSIARSLPRRPHFVTMLREPVARAISRFDSAGKTPHHPLHAAVARGDLGLAEWLDHPRGGKLDENRQVRQLAGTPSRLRDGDRVELAAERLADFACFGIRERFEESVELLCLTFGWSDPDGASRPRATRAETAATRVSDGLRALIASRNALDVALYARARSLFLERWAASRHLVAGRIRGYARNLSDR